MLATLLLVNPFPFPFLSFPFLVFDFFSLLSSSFLLITVQVFS